MRVEVIRSGPDQIARDNEFLMQAVKICAEAGTPLPADAVIRLMQGEHTKTSVLRAMTDAGIGGGQAAPQT